MYNKDFVIIQTQNIIEQGFLDNKKIYLFGTNNLSDSIVDYLILNNFHVEAYLDNNELKHFKKRKGKLIYPPSHIINEECKENVVFLIASSYFSEMKEQLKQLGYTAKNQIFEVMNMRKEALLNDVDFWSEFNQTYYKKCVEAIKVYENITNEEKVKLFIFPSVALGDIFKIASYFELYLSKANIENYKFITKTKNNYNLLKKYGICNVSIVSDKDFDLLIYLSKIFQDEIKILHVNFMHYEVFQDFYCFNKLSFNDFYKLGIFNLDESDKFIEFEENNHSNILSVVSNYGLNKGNSIVLAPYARTVPLFDLDFWESIAERLKNKGYNIYTNCGNNKEQPIKGTQALNFDILYAKEIFDHCHALVSLRSGLCDVITNSKCKKIILYPEEIMLGTTLYEFYSMNNELNTKKNIIEYSVSEENISQVVEDIILRIG